MPEACTTNSLPEFRLSRQKRQLYLLLQWLLLHDLV
jgi:hypothetical protein